jgi:hypothetical protein
VDQRVQADDGVERAGREVTRRIQRKLYGKWQLYGT